MSAHHDSHTKRGIWLHILATFLVLLGALNWGSIALVDVDWIARALYSFNPVITRVTYGAVGAAGIYLLLNRDTWLPFLTKSAFPCAPLAEKHPADATAAYTVRTGVPHANVVYWAAESSSDVSPNPWMAYSQYNNSGISRSDENGVAVLKLRRPGKYSVPVRGTLESHVHYRVCLHPGMLSSVQTLVVK